MSLAGSVPRESGAMIGAAICSCFQYLRCVTFDHLTHLWITVGLVSMSVFGSLAEVASLANDVT